MSNMDPITTEIIKNRLNAIAEEMVATMKRTAGTLIYAEIGDFSCGLFDYRARQVVYGGMCITHNLAIQNLIQTSIKIHGEDPGIFNGDIFMGNDPYLGGGIHAMELGLVSPIFVGDEIVAWSGSIAHQLDIGGMNPGGFCLDATDCFQEGLRLPPVKLYQKGELQRDIWNIHRNNVRLPDKISMELKGQIAANNVAKKRIYELVNKYGVETVQKACEGLIQLSARVTEERIRQIPEGIYQHMDFGEAMGIADGLFPIYCDLMVEDGKLIFDFTRECPPPVPRIINSTKLVVKGMVCSFLLPFLCYDVPWNEGCTYPIQIVTTPNTILDAQPPVPCGDPVVSFRAADAALGALDKALVHSPLKNRMSACWTFTPPITLGTAMGPDGRLIVIPLLESMSGGGGAFSIKDGLDAGSGFLVMKYSMGDVETQESASPILYLTRRFLRDSGGPGRYRGGVCTLVAVIPHKTNGLKFYLTEDHRLVSCHGTMGGYPGASNHWWVGRRIDVSKAIREGLGEPEEVLPKLELLPAHGALEMGPQDAFVFTSGGGGGGFGDPLSRDPEKVARDVLWKFVSVGKAREIYGVVFKPGGLEVDELHTKQEREKLKAQRLPDGRMFTKSIMYPEGYYTVLKETEHGIMSLCGGCHKKLSSIGENWKEKVPHRDLHMDQTGMLIPRDERVVLRQYICPDCGFLLDSEVTLKSLKPLWDFRPIK